MICVCYFSLYLSICLFLSRFLPNFNNVNASACLSVYSLVYLEAPDYEADSGTIS